jgi:U4/U6.U5 tri-snRNP component SNU23
MSGRRTWDKDEYAKKAKERAEMGDDYDAQDTSSSKAKAARKEEFMKADEGAQGPMGSERAFLKVREERVDLESKVGKTQVINQSELERGAGAGYFCETCNCLLKDSISYLDHINGKKHLRALGFSMRVERAGVDKVKSKLDSLKRKISEAKDTVKVSAIDDYETRMAVQRSEEEGLKKRRREEKLARRRESEAREMESAHMDPEIAAMMGFGGFGSSKK